MKADEIFAEIKDILKSHDNKGVVISDYVTERKIGIERIKSWAKENNYYCYIGLPFFTGYLISKVPHSTKEALFEV